MSPARKRAESEHEVDDLFDQVDVPAAVICAFCRDAECPGCASEMSRSGVVAVVPWERPGAAFFTRLWMTARAATLDSERFFESLPDGPIGPALRFAVTCEMLAASAVVGAGACIAAIVSPVWLKHVALGDGALLVRLLVLGVPSLALLLVLAHVAHGLAIDSGARREGARGARSRALRFGLYSTGWDLLIGPAGALALAVKEGGRASLRLGMVAFGLPARSVRAFLRGCYHLDGVRAERPLRASYAAAMLTTVVGAIAILAAAVFVALI